MERQHPGGHRVIQLVKGREVDRFIYGMYSAELYPELAAYSHSMYSLELVGNPIAKLITPPTYAGYESEVTEMRIEYVNCIAKKTQIYQLGLAQRTKSLKYLGYTDLRQLGQYYTFSTVNGVTRIYTTVNFLQLANVNRMNKLLDVQRNSP